MTPFPIAGGWNGMVGELLRREAEVAIAPLTINSQREQVLSWTNSYFFLLIQMVKLICSLNQHLNWDLLKSSDY